jgi:hypothetical protein
MMNIVPGADQRLSPCSIGLLRNHARQERKASQVATLQGSIAIGTQLMRREDPLLEQKEERCSPLGEAAVSSESSLARRKVSTSLYRGRPFSRAGIQGIRERISSQPGQIIRGGG